MLEELHELLGGAGAATMATVVALGTTLYLYPRLRHLLPLPRSRLVQLHRWGAVLFLPLALGHYLLAPQMHPLQPLGTVGLVAVFALGWGLRLDKRNYRPLVRGKAVLAMVAAAALLLGHIFVEEREQGHDEDHHSMQQTLPLENLSRLPAIDPGMRG